MLFRDYDEEGVKKVIYEDGVAEGLEKGRKILLEELIREGVLTHEQALQYADVTEEELASFTGRDQ